MSRVVSNYRRPAARGKHDRVSVGACGLTDLFDQLTDRARGVLDLARDEARRLGHPYVGTEHVLLALVADETDVTSRALSQLGVEPGGARQAVGFIFGPADAMHPPAEELELSPIAIRVVKRAAAEARRHNQPTVDSGHLLLGLIREGGRGVGILKVLGVNLERLRLRVLTELGTPPAQPPASPPEAPESPWFSANGDG